MDDILNDNRFAHIVRDPRFMRIPKKMRKVKIDKRFKSMFNDSRFKVKYSVDKRGRPTNVTSAENLKRYYELESSSVSEESSDEEETGKKPKKKEKPVKDPRKKKTERSDEKTFKKGNTSANGFTVTPIADNLKKCKKQIKKPDVSDDKDSSNGTGSSDSDNQDDRDSGNEAESGDSDFVIGDGDESNEEAVPLPKKLKKRLKDMKVDYARGEGILLTDSSSDESSDDEGEEEDVDHGWGELDRDAEHTDEVTCRLALCNMDWDRVHADDLMVLFHSFLPTGGVIHSITVYPSEYGLKRMKEEDEKGPQELRELKEMLEAQRREEERRRKEEEEDDDDDEEDADEEEEEEDDEEGKEGKEDQKAELSGGENEDPEEEGGDGSHYEMEKLRQYQLSRLKYYYAVLVFDSPQTANAVYEVCDGREYETTSTRLDLRFVPDDMTFDQEPHETCTSLPNMKKYEPLLFTNTALQQSKVLLTWDETDPRRKKVTTKLMEGKVDGIDESDLKAYLASSSEEEEEQGANDKEGAAAKYRALLQTIDDEEKKKKSDVDMEVKWGIGLKETIDKRLKEGTLGKLTPFQQMIHKKQEKMKTKREARKMRYKEEDGEEKSDENESASSEEDIPSGVDMNDSYFREEFENDEFEKPSRKGSKTAVKKEKKNKKHAETGNMSDDEESGKRKAELELLVMDEDDGRQHFSLKDLLMKDKKKKKGRKKKKKAEEEQALKKQDDFQLNVKDERFSALFSSHLYNIDPADPHYKKTQAMEMLRKHKLTSRVQDEEVQKKVPKLELSETSKLDPEMSVLVKNVKMKTKLAKK